MMQILELIAFTNSMKKVILTVLKQNQNSNFFRALNYKLDETSPTDNFDEKYCYEILSKINKNLLPVQAAHNHTSNGCCPGHHHH